MNPASQQPIDVTVQSEYAAAHSDPAHDRYVFIYHITIRNHGQQPVQLISRHWLISDANGHVDEVNGEGVIGEQPVIRPGDAYAYSSFSVLATPVGCMQGSYQMVSADDTAFDAPIPPFTLACPGSLN